jgi:hypothetical protein
MAQKQNTDWRRRQAMFFRQNKLAKRRADG